MATASKAKEMVWGTGRRKTSVARVRITPGSGAFTINGKPYETFFPNAEDRSRVTLPFRATETMNKFDAFAQVEGGGFTGQSGAVLLGLARALMKQNEAYEAALRGASLLTRDSRMKERKKYGQRGARRKFQFSKR